MILKNEEKIHYLLRDVAKVDKILNQSEDSAIGEILERIFINPRDICEYINWGECEFQLNKAIDILRNKL